MAKGLVSKFIPAERHAAVDLCSHICGTLRPSGSYIGMLLELEDPDMRLMVLSDVMEKLNITPKDITAYRREG